MVVWKSNSVGIISLHAIDKLLDKSKTNEGENLNNDWDPRLRFILLKLSEVSIQENNN